MRIALAQMNATVGDFPANLRKALAFVDRAKSDRADLVVFPEFTLVGYPPGDLLLRDDFLRASLAALDAFVSSVHGIHAVVGYPEPNPARSGRALFNSMAVAGGGRLLHTYRKQLLPTYDVFDEARYFEPGDGSGNLLTLDSGFRLGLTLCEDVWCDPFDARCLYHTDPVANLVDAPADVILNISASPYGIGKPPSRPAMYARQARRMLRPLIVINQVGARDDLVFDGNSCAFSATGQVLAHCREFAEDLLTVDLSTPAPTRIEMPVEGPASIAAAITYAIREFVHGTDRTGVLVPLDGTPASLALAALASRALGPTHVLAVPVGTHPESITQALGIRSRPALLSPLYEAHECATGHPLTDVTRDRLHASLLRNLADQLECAPLSPATKTDLARGGGLLIPASLAPLADLTSTRLASLLPHLGLPSAPPADSVFDQVLELYIAQEQSLDAITAATNLPTSLVHDVVQTITRSEPSRLHAALPLKLTPRTFGRSRPIPLRHRFHP